jgi:preprotein translocase subunit SecE
MSLSIYKKGQGKYTRLCSAFGVGIFAVLGCYRLYVSLDAWNIPGLSNRSHLWVSTMVPAGLFVALALLIVWLANKPSIADFMIASEGEMKKVSWSSKQEIFVSTVVVIVVVIVMAVLLGITDLSFRTLFDWLLLGEAAPTAA